jgi:hypothetical protein
MQKTNFPTLNISNGILDSKLELSETWGTTLCSKKIVLQIVISGKRVDNLSKPTLCGLHQHYLMTQ